MEQKLCRKKERFWLWKWTVDSNEGFWKLDDENDFVTEGTNYKDCLKQAELKMDRATVFVEELPYGRIYEDCLHGSRFLLQDINIHSKIPFEVPHCF